jgi:PAS domain S-box-containing protein
MLMIWLLCGPVLAQMQPQTALAGKNILILHEIEYNVPILVATNRALIEVLESGGISIRNQFYENLDFGRNPEPEHRKKVAELLQQRYSNRQVDLIVTTYAGALKFALNEGRTIFPQAPIIALYLAPGMEISESNRVIIRHSTAVDPSSTLESALKLLPKTKQVYVVSGVHINDKRLENVVRQEFKKWEGRLEFFYLSDLPMEKILATVSSLPENSIVLLPSLQTDVLGTIFTTREAVRRVSQASNAPVFGLVDVGLGYGLVGGYLISYELMGRKAGELGLEILRSGIQNAVGYPKNIEVRPIPMYDGRQLKRWGLNASALPKGSIVINRELTFWDFKYYIIGGIAVLLAQTLLVIGLLIQRQRKIRVEASLRQKTEELDQFFNVSLDIMCIANTDGYFLRLNPAVEKILGYTYEELMAKRLFEFVHPNDLGRTHEAISSLASQQKIFLFENRYRCKDGTYRWLQWSSVPVGKMIYAAARDITDRKRAEQEAFDARRELLRMDRLSRMGEMSASLSHELNQPLTAILSNAGAALRLLQADELSPGELKEILQDIVKDDKRAGDIIRSLRTLVSRDEGEREMISINDVLHEAVSLFRSEAIFRNIRIEMDLADPLPLLYINKVQIQQVLINLMMNAGESMTRDEFANKAIVLQTLVSQGGMVQVAVRDFGSGIEEPDLRRIFEPFFTTKRSGLGMGLSLSRSIIESHGGHIWAENNPDKGITFYFDLPGISDR